MCRYSSYRFLWRMPLAWSRVDEVSVFSSAQVLTKDPFCPNLVHLLQAQANSIIRLKGNVSNTPYYEAYCFQGYFYTFPANTVSSLNPYFDYTMLRLISCRHFFRVTLHHRALFSQKFMVYPTRVFFSFFFLCFLFFFFNKNFLPLRLMSEASSRLLKWDFIYYLFKTWARMYFKKVNDVTTLN